MIRCVSLASLLGAFVLVCGPGKAHAREPVVLVAEPDAVATCHALEVELASLGIGADMFVLTSADPDDLDLADRPDRAALVLCRTAPLRFEIFRGASMDALSGAPDHVALSSPSDPGAAAVEASEWVRALLIALPDAPPDVPAIDAPTDAPPAITNDAPASRLTFALSLPYLYAGPTLRAMGVAGTVGYAVGPRFALAARLTTEAQPMRTFGTDEPFRVRHDRIELGVEHVAGFGRFSLRSGVHLGGTRIAVRGRMGPDLRPQTSARTIGTGMLRVAAVYRVASHVAVGLEADAGTLFREVEVTQGDGATTIGRFLGSFGLRLEVTR